MGERDRGSRARRERPGHPPRPGAAILVAIVLVMAALIGGTLVLATALAPRPTPFVVPSGAAGSLQPAATGTPGVGAGSAGLSGVPVDPSLLAVLPASVAGVTLAEDPDTAARVASDPAHRSDLSALAVAVAAGAGSGDFAVASIILVRPGVYSDAYYKDWRDTFDGGACQQSGGTGPTIESTVAGHDTFIGHCVGGLLTYHVHLVGPDRILSVSSVGAKELGRLIVEGLR